MKNKTIIAFVFAIAMLATSILALPTVEYVKINGETYETGDNVEVFRGDVLEIKIKLQAGNTSEDNIVAEADILGYEYGDRYPVSDSAPTFDLDAGDTAYKTLELTVPENADRDYYDLRIRVAGRTGEAFDEEYRLHLKGLRHQLIIKDILVDEEIMAGRGLFVNAKVKNLGEKTEDDITVKVEIPELGLVEYTTIEELEADESITTEDVVLLIPECAKSGEYDIEVTLDYNDYDAETKTTQIEVIKNDVCGSSNQGGSSTEKTVISVPSAQEAKVGEGASFPIMITNMGASSKTYTISVSPSIDAIGTYRIDPSNVVIINAGQTKTVYIYVDLKDDVQTGLKDFAVSVKTGSETENIPLTINVIKSDKATSSFDLKNALMIGFVVLLIILILLGLIWGFNKIKGKDEEKEEEDVTQTYY